MAGQPLGSFEYELTDDLAYEAGMALFELQARKVKEDVVRRGMPHALVPIVLVSMILVVAMTAAAIVAWDSLLTLPLLVVAGLVQLLLLFKAALYFCPPFTRWYIRRLTNRELRRLSHRTIRWRLFEDRLETESAAVQRSLAWTDLRRLQTLPTMWSLHWKSGLTLLAPVEALTPPLQALIQRQASAVGGEISSDDGRKKREGSTLASFFDF